MGKSILIVDDSESIREVVSFTLESAGHQVMKAENGQDEVGTLGAIVDRVRHFHIKDLSPSSDCVCRTRETLGGFVGCIQIWVWVCSHAGETCDGLLLRH